MNTKTTKKLFKSIKQKSDKEKLPFQKKTSDFEITISTIQRKKSCIRWSEEEDKQLRDLVKKHGAHNWKIIAENMSGRSAVQCQNRWNITLQDGLIKGPWSAEEDQKLREWVEKYGPTKWTKCSEQIIGRSGKQCREHWNNTLNSLVKKGDWNQEEDFFIFYFYKKFNGSWKDIIPIFEGRTENSIKNRFFSQLRKIASLDESLKDHKNSAKIKLKTLIKYVGKAYEEAKDDILREKNISNEEEYEKYKKEIEKKMEEMTKKKFELKEEKRRKLKEKNKKGTQNLNEKIDKKDNNSNDLNHSLSMDEFHGDIENIDTFQDKDKNINKRIDQVTNNKDNGRTKNISNKAKDNNSILETNDIDDIDNSLLGKKREMENSNKNNNNNMMCSSLNVKIEPESSKNINNMTNNLNNNIFIPPYTLKGSYNQSISNLNLPYMNQPSFSFNNKTSYNNFPNNIIQNNNIKNSNSINNNPFSSGISKTNYKIFSNNFSYGFNNNQVSYATAPSFGCDDPFINRGISGTSDQNGYFTKDSANLGWVSIDAGERKTTNNNINAKSEEYEELPMKGEKYLEEAISLRKK